MDDDATAHEPSGSVPPSGPGDSFPVIAAPEPRIPWGALFRLTACCASYPGALAFYGWPGAVIPIIQLSILWIFVMDSPEAIGDVMAWFGDINARKSIKHHRASVTWYARANGARTWGQIARAIRYAIIECLKGKK